MSQLGAQDFQRFVGLLKQADAFRTRRERLALLEAALAEHEDASHLIRELNLEGSPAVVAEGVVRDLERMSTAGRSAVADLAEQLLRRGNHEPSDRSFLLHLARDGQGTRPATGAAGARPRREYQPSDEQVVDFATGRSSRKRIFVLHSHGSPEDDALVRQLADSLRDEFEVVVDFDRDMVERGWFVWSANEYELADYIVIAASREWCRRFSDFVHGEHPERYAYGKGVRFESNLITADIVNGATGRLILVLFNEDDRDYRHRILLSLNRFVWPADDKKLKNALRSNVSAAGQTAADSDVAERGFVFRPSLAPGDVPQPSRLPIVVAIEDATNALTDDALPGMERHMVVTLSHEQVTFLQGVGTDLSIRATNIDDLAALGQEVWRVLESAQPSLRRLLERAGEEGALQPVAWTGFTDLLCKISTAISIATLSRDSTSSCMTLAFGAHYFCPLATASTERNINPRLPGAAAGSSGGRPLKVRRFATDLEDVSGSPEIAALGDAEIALLSVPSIEAAAPSLAASLEASYSAAPAVRVVAVFGTGVLDGVMVDRLLAQVPCLSLGGSALRHSELISSVEEWLTRLASQRAVPSIIAALRREWVRLAAERDDWAAFLDGLLWTVWSWVGRPLFATDFGQPPPPVYPHLMDLRSIVSTGWYHERREGVPECYEAAALVRADQSPADRFHLYLSGAGGTGKSCFLRSVYDTLVNRDDVLAVWHRVDAPSSEWKDVAARLKQHCALALQRKVGEDRTNLDPRGNLRLSDYLLKVLKTARSSEWGVTEVVIFLDQLERTFESGDEPEFDRLKNIAHEIMELLVDVGVGQGIRVFIASRKQYLPDFLHSSQHAIKSGLQFNVLQSISEASDQKGFVDDVQNWCRREHLVDESVRIESEAAHELAKKVGGHPLNMMLALIQLLAENRRGRITTAVLHQSRPWERLFGFDERMMAKSDLDWYSILAMAHARTEIVRFEEVWWRLRLVGPELSAQADRLGKTRFVERLWLLGHLGRTIHARPQNEESFGFLEFFHANLRDYLLRDVMSYGGIDARFSRRAGGTPPAWRALDRLWAAAHEWDQIQQVLTAEEVRSLMEHRTVVIERPHGGADPNDDTFSLLFVRDSRDRRARLQQSAKECFVFSALVHDDFGRWAFQEVFPDVDARVDCCRRWMRRGGHEARARLVQYLIESGGDSPRQYLVSLVLGDGEAGQATWQDVAAQLAEPLMAARYRADVVVSVLEALGHEGLDRESSRKRLRDFVTAACGGENHDVLSLLASCAYRLEGSPVRGLQSLAGIVATGAFLDLSSAVDASPVKPAIPVRGPTMKAPAKIQIVAGSDLVGIVTHGQVETWRQELSEAFGIPLPATELTRGDVEPAWLELRINGKRVAHQEVYASRRRILKRHWDERHDFPARDAIVVDDDTAGELALWLEDAYLAQIGWDRPSTTSVAAVFSWLDDQLRRQAEAVVDLDVVNEFLKDIEVTTDVARVFRQFSLHDFVRVVRHLVHERVPFGGVTGRAVLMQALSDLALGPTDIDVALQRVREHFGVELCKVHIDRSHGCLYGIEIDPDLEDALTAHDAPPLASSPALAQALAAAVRRHTERTRRAHDAMPVIKCSTALRLPLLRMLERFDPRVVVLSASELPPDAPWMTVARLDASLLPRTEIRAV